MSKFVKDLISSDLQNRLNGCKDLLVVDAAALEGMTTNTLRLKLQKQDISMLAVKNTLARRVLGELGLPGLDTVLKGPSVLVWGGPDIVALSKEISKWARDLKGLEIKGGIVDGTAVTASDVDAISKGPSREELIGQVLTLILSPGARLAGALHGPGGRLSGQVKSIAEKEPAAEAAEAEVATA